MASTEHFNRRKFCQLTAAGLGSALVSSAGYARPKAPAAPNAKTPKQAAGNIEPLPFVPGSYTLAVLPDTQGYCGKRYPHHFYNQTKWIAENVDAHQIKYVIHLGDVTQQNQPRQWEIGQRAMKMLNGKVPYLVATGNHDYGPNGNASTRDTLFHQPNYFGPGSPYAAQSSIGGFYEAGKTDN